MTSAHRIKSAFTLSPINVKGNFVEIAHIAKHLFELQLPHFTYCIFAGRCMNHLFLVIEKIALHNDIFSK